jgi:hypothetical protein
MKFCKKFNTGNAMNNTLKMGFVAAFTVFTLAIMSAQAGGEAPPIKGGIADLRYIKTKMTVNVSASNNTTARNADEGSATTGDTTTGTTSGEVSTAGTATCDFSGFAQNDLIHNAYAGGASLTGVVKPNIHIGYFDARVLNAYFGANEPNPGIAYTNTGSILVSLQNITGTNFAFSYTCAVKLTVRTFSSVDGSGTALSTYTLAKNLPGTVGPYNVWTNFSQPIDPTVRSILISGDAARWGMDQVVVQIMTDCNNNGIADATDINNGTAQDCNGNGIPDLCDIDSGFAKDCNNNHIPDSCDLSGQQTITSISFEEFRGVNKTVITNQYPGLVFETSPNGSKWTANDVTKGDWNAVGWDCETETATGLATNYPNYWLCGQVWCYPQDPYGGSGTIRLLGNGASFFQLRYCAGSNLYLIAYDSDGAQIDIDVKPANRRLNEGNYSGPGTLRVEAPAGKRIASVVVHDSGNFWVIDGISTDVGVIAPLPDCNDNGIPDSCELADGSAVDQNGNGVPDSCDPFPVLRLTTNAADCNTVGSTVTVDATLSGVLNNVVAGQLLLTWDVSKLSFATVLPGDAPYTTAYALNEQSGTIMILASTTAGGTGTTAASAVVSRIQFTVIGGSCSGTGNEVDFFTFGPMETEFTDGYGGATVPTLLASAGFVVDDGAPVLSNVPANFTVQAEAGMGSFANVALTAPTATDACAPGLTASSSRSDGASLGAAFPVGETTVTWSATDPCGNVTRAITSVTVNNYNTGTFGVSYTNSGSYAANSARLLTLNIHGANGYTLKASQPITLVNGAGTISLTDLAVDNYDCVAIEEQGRSLRRVATTSDAGLIWSSTATLVAGDLIDDEVIDVLDWGAYIVGNPNADLDGNSVINAVDGNIIIANFGLRGETGCGTSFMGTPDPISAISVAELVNRGLTDLIGADLNNDGWLDMEDVRLAN